MQRLRAVGAAAGQYTFKHQSNFQMNRRRKPATRSQPPKEKAVEVPSAAEEVADGRSVPGPRLKRLLSVWLLFHLLVVGLSLTATVDPSETQSRVLESVQFYITPTHFSADGLPVYLAWGGASEQPHRLQTSNLKPSAAPGLFSLPIDDSRWTTVPPTGPTGGLQNDRYTRWLSTVATLAENEQPSLAAELLLPAVSVDSSIQAIRIVRLPTELTTIADDQAPPPYSAAVARKNNRVSLVQISEPRLSTNKRVNHDE